LDRIVENYQQADGSIVIPDDCAIHGTDRILLLTDIERFRISPPVQY